MDEAWVRFFEPETKQKLMEWKHSGPPKSKEFRVLKSAGKAVSSVFFFWIAKELSRLMFWIRVEQ